MKFRVRVRPFSARDVSLDCPYTPTFDEYSQELELLIREINEAPQCSSASLDRDAINVDASFSDVREMKDGLRSLFSKYICFVRFVDAEVLPTAKR